MVKGRGEGLEIAEPGGFADVLRWASRVSKAGACTRAGGRLCGESVRERRADQAWTEWHE